MARVWGEADDGVAAKPIAETVDELRQTLRPCCGIKADPGLRRRQRIYDECAQRYHLDAEAGVEAIQLLAEEPAQMAGRSGGPAGADGGPRHCAVGPESGKLQPSRPIVRGLQASADIY